MMMQEGLCIFGIIVHSSCLVSLLGVLSRKVTVTFPKSSIVSMNEICLFPMTCIYNVCSLHIYIHLEYTYIHVHIYVILMLEIIFFMLYSALNVSLKYSKQNNNSQT